MYIRMQCYINYFSTQNAQIRRVRVKFGQFGKFMI